jgi:peptidylprolyl isomerase
MLRNNPVIRPTSSRAPRGGGGAWSARIAAALAAFAAAAAHADPLEGRKSPAEIVAETTAEDWRAIPPEDILVIALDRGAVYVALSPHLAPAHVKQARKLAREHFYDGLSFYRVIDGFVAQGGDPFGERRNPAKKSLKAAFETPAAAETAFFPLPDSDGFAPEVGFLASLPTGRDPQKGTLWHLHCPGAFAFGREDAPDTAATEFYVALTAQRYLDRNMSVMGRVIEGMQHLQALRRVDPPQSKDDDLGETIVSVRLLSDVPEAERPQFEILDSARPAFAALAEARRNRPEAFFHYRPDHLDICQFPVPVRRKE